jgi:regulatory protein
MKTITESEALSRVAFYCSSAEHCRCEVEEKLRKWSLDEQAIGRILQKLESERYVDDDRYCRAFVADKINFAKWGKMKISRALSMKKIDDKIIQNICLQIDRMNIKRCYAILLPKKRERLKAVMSIKYRANSYGLL